MRKIYVLTSIILCVGGAFAQCTITPTSTNVSCNGLANGTATVTPTGSTPGYSYLWSPGGQTTANVNSLSVGSYTVTVTDANSCVATTVVTITGPPQFNITITATNASNSTACDGSTSAFVSGGTPPYTYMWLPGGQTGSTISNQCAGTYYFQVTDSLFCVKSDSAYSIGVTSFEEIFSGNTGNNIVHISPNPSAGQFFILFNKQISDAKISVTNIVGQAVFQAAITNLKMEIDMAQQPNGIYFVYVITKDNTLTQKIAIQK